MDYNLGSALTSSRTSERQRHSDLTVLFIDNSSTFGGAIISLKHLVEGLVELGIKPLVLSGQSTAVMRQLFSDAHIVDGDVPTDWRRETATKRLIGRIAPDNGVLRRLAHELSKIEWLFHRIIPTALSCARIGFRYDVDLIHLNNTLESQLHGLLAARMLGVPCVAHARGFQQTGRLVKMALERVDNNIAISHAIEKNLLAIGAPADRIALVHDAIDTSEFTEPKDTTAIRRELDIPLDASTFGLIGRIVKWKGVKEFISAAIQVLGERPDSYALIIGDESDGDPLYFEEVQQLAQQTAVGERIVFTGYLDDVSAVVQLLDLVVHTSIRPEPFGLVVVEAMAAGKPVVATSQGGPLDTVVDGETGLLVDPQDTVALAGAIGRILDDPDLAQSMGSAGRRRALEHFDARRYAREVADVYRDVCGVTPSSPVTGR